ncbi:MAG: ubiquinol-cytochrome c reductase iron-sulfur subunit, partial [Thermoanaerobaculia bacterium]
GVVDTRFVDRYGVWIVNNDNRIYALIAICTHLGCPPAWLDTQNKFKCPCHGSGYYKSGINFEGPTPRPLERARIYISPDDGQIVVDKAQKYQWELGQWEDPNSYIPA